MKISAENVRIIEQNILTELEMWGAEDKLAEQLVHYIAGVHDMSTAVIEAIRELGGGAHETD